MPSQVTLNDGSMVEMQDLVVPAAKIHNFVQINKEAYFEDHSLDWALDEILTRGMAEITRQIKTAKKTAENKAAGSLLKEFNMTPAQAKALLLELAKQTVAAAK